MDVLPISELEERPVVGPSEVNTLIRRTLPSWRRTVAHRPLPAAIVDESLVSPGLNVRLCRK